MKLVLDQFGSHTWSSLMSGAKQGCSGMFFEAVRLVYDFLT